MFCFQHNNYLLIELKFILLLNLTTFVVLICLSCMNFFFNKPGLFKTDFEQVQKPSLCKVVGQLWQDKFCRLMFSRDFTDIKSGESFDIE